MSTAYHPQTDGQTERVNQVLEQYLRTYCFWDQKNWMELLPYAEFCYNNTVYSSTKMTPFYANFGYHPGHNYPAVQVISTVPPGEELILTHKKLREDMRDTLILAQKRMAKYYNQRVSTNEPTFKVGDWVMLNAKDIKTIRSSKKLDHKMRGKFKVKKLVGTHAYELELPVRSGKHPVFHISMLEPYHHNTIPNRRSPTPLPEIDLDGELNYPVEKIVSSKVHYRKVHYLVKWEGYSDDQNTWEPYDNLMMGATEAIKDFRMNNPTMPKDPRMVF